MKAFADYGDRHISQDVEVHAYKNGVRIWNQATKKYTTKKLRWVSGEACEGDSLAVFCDKQGRRGYYNINTGEVVTPAQYKKAWNFSEGLPWTGATSTSEKRMRMDTALCALPKENA